MRTTGILLVLACLAAAVPWELALSRMDQYFVLFALAPPMVMGLLVLIRDAGLRNENPA